MWGRRTWSMCVGVGDWMGRGRGVGLGRPGTATRGVAVEGGSDPLATYRARVAKGSLLWDPTQEEALRMGMTLLQEVARSAVGGQVRESPGQGLGREEGVGVGGGLYLWGPVGSGKSMVMDMLAAGASGTGISTERVHYDAFMVDLHRGLHRAMQQAMVPVKGVTRAEGGRDALDVFRYVERSAVDTGNAHRSTSSSPSTSSTPPSSSSSSSSSHPVHAVADAMADRGVRLMCLDEVQVADVADALLLTQFFERLIKVRGVACVFTSNTWPEGLWGGPEASHQRVYFQPFVDLVLDRMRVHRVGVSVQGDEAATRGRAPELVGVDYRKVVLAGQGRLPEAEGGDGGGGGGEGKAHTPMMGAFVAGEGSGEMLLQQWDAKMAELGVGAVAEQRNATFDVPHQRPLTIPRFARHLSSGQVLMAQFPFHLLCGNRMGRTLAASDYLVLSGLVARGLFVTGVPVFRTARARSEGFQMGLPNGVDEARRLVALTDAFYDAGVPLFLSSDEATPGEGVDSLFTDLAADALAKNNREEAVMYARCASRLTAMTSRPDWTPSKPPNSRHP